MDITSVTNAKARKFLNTFFMHRAINREFYERVPELQFDFRITPKSDSVRESLAHQINVEKAYLLGIATGTLIFGVSYDKSLHAADKDFLLHKLDRMDHELVGVLTNEENLIKSVSVPWNQEGESVLDMLWALNNHEILHTGWNIAVMDHLNMERFSALKKMWG